MDNGLISLGWYMRRTEDAERLAHFYRDTLGLPLLRGEQPVFMFWAGEALVFELKSDEAPVNHRETDPETAPCIPIFRVHSMPVLLHRLTTAGTKVVSEKEVDGGREAYVLDTDNQLIGFREMSPESALPTELEARRRRADKSRFDPGVGPMPDEIQDLGWILCRYQDSEKIAGFYRDVVGLAEVAGLSQRSSFDFGDNVVLEIAGGGPELPLPKDRIEVTNSYILRFQKTAPFKSRLESLGVSWPNDHIQWKRAHLAYFADPENHIVGIEERYDPSEYPPGVESFAEDLEAERRYREGLTQ